MRALPRLMALAVIVAGLTGCGEPQPTRSLCDLETGEAYLAERIPNIWRHSEDSFKMIRVPALDSKCVKDTK